MSEPEDKSEKVKKAMAGRRKVTPETTPLRVIEGGKAKPKRASRAKAKGNSPEIPESSPPPHDEPPIDDRDGPPSDTPPEDIEKAKECAPLDPNDRDNGRRLIIWFGSDL